MRVGIGFEAAKKIMLADQTCQFKESRDACYGIDKRYWDDEVEGVMVLSFGEQTGWYVTDNPSAWFIPPACTKELNEDNDRGE